MVLVTAEKWSTSMATNAIALNGTTQYGLVSPNALIDTMIPGTGTIEGWFWNDSTTTEDYMQAACIANIDSLSLIHI